ncbi:MAG TPA: hypothetical protein VM911_21400 [Pyrinomonadaceae bacterium]|jgi:hypothetical protein|nr:hypothetical protein [Pyrinomonadaceae bacterium]
MTESQYRLGKFILLLLMTSGSLFVGWRVADAGQRLAENGRFQQVDVRKMEHYSPNSEAKHVRKAAKFDTRTGKYLPE